MGHYLGVFFWYSGVLHSGDIWCVMEKIVSDHPGGGDGGGCTRLPSIDDVVLISVNHAIP